MSEGADVTMRHRLTSAAESGGSCFKLRIAYHHSASRPNATRQDKKDSRDKKNEPQPLGSWGSTPNEFRVRGWGASPGA
jgi:hypothetical protein